ncbi:MAG: MTH938/NDUFAF3 family protein [Pseudomonadota bacterium]|nr:MTH938/NDUFAF3 family protein [Pseudomonadota bacterium]
MELTQEPKDSKNFIKNYENSVIYIGESSYKYDIILSPKNIREWEIDQIENLSLKDFSGILGLDPEIIIIGTGDKMIVPKREIINNIYGQGIGLEYMKTDSACKTFNILLSEERKVVAALHI